MGFLKKLKDKFTKNNKEQEETYLYFNIFLCHYIILLCNCIILYTIIFINSWNLFNKKKENKNKRPILMHINIFNMYLADNFNSYNEWNANWTKHKYIKHYYSIL